MAKKKSPVESGVGVLRLKLGACMTHHTKRAVADLHQTAADLRAARNAMVRYWERWREDNPGWQPEQRRDRKGEPKEVNGKPVLEHPSASQDLENSIYVHGRTIAPKVAGIVLASARQEVMDRLKARLPYNHEGSAKFRWEGILANEVARDCYRVSTIPVPNNSAIFCYEGVLSRKLTAGVNQRVREAGKSCAIIRFPLFSRDAGRENVDAIFRLETRQLSRGNRDVLRKIAAGEWKMRDSELVHERGKWFFNLTYHQPRQPLAHLIPEWVATLSLMAAGASHPLGIDFENHHWDLGHVRVLLAEQDRLDRRRAVLRERYKYTGNARRGHGRKRFESAVRPASRQLRNHAEQFAEKLVADVIRFCDRFSCGKLLYREPTMPLRQRCWFSNHRAQFDWTGLESRLTHKCWIHGIEMEVERMGMDEHRRSSLQG